MRTTLGFIGSGLIGSTLARLATAAGVDVVMSNSRGPETLGGLVAELGDRARAATTRDAARDADLVVVTVPLTAYPDLPVAALAGKTVIDTTNYYPQRDGRIAELDADALTSSELLQRRLSSSDVVKAVNNVFFHQLGMLARPSAAPDRSALPIAGDDDAAKHDVVRLLDTLGYDAVDTGTLATSWRSEPTTPVYVMPYAGTLPEGLGAAELQQWMATTGGVPVSAAQVKDLVAAAVRGPAGGSF
ncbi:NADPH-dependent F420 reductase [Amycolatopsis sp. WQ 127309]|uniref:NADPH-dependent F420 reductase n=1 Tax=Amycolatopsis sp. WQ 127309 TaxID=2932773 RepID=UPI001FF19E56|nr:NAD(P)-binding domain-containing protein [Amycolatopsis sp. WQ 127309]UOZ03482.1 NAD(P)-binding domain-containing protein [Amycolatopsis sp. WQ 127309]